MVPGESGSGSGDFQCFREVQNVLLRCVYSLTEFTIIKTGSRVFSTFRRFEKNFSFVLKLWF